MKPQSPRKVKAVSERSEQRALIEWASYLKIPLVHHANEGKRSKLEGYMLKQIGLAPGYPDLSLSQARGGYFGLFIELKQNRKYSNSEMNTKCWKEQSRWLTRLANEHYFAIRCYGWEHAKNIIEKYLSWPKTLFNSPSII